MYHVEILRYVKLHISAKSPYKNHAAILYIAEARLCFQIPTLGAKPPNHCIIFNGLLLKGRMIISCGFLPK